MPDPKAVFTAFKADLEAVGITVNEISKPWNGGYLDGVEAQQADLFLLGWTGDYNTPDNFIGTFFTRDRQPVRHRQLAVGHDAVRGLAEGRGRDPGRRGADRRVRGAEQAAPGRIPAGGADLALAAGASWSPVTCRG